MFLESSIKSYFCDDESFLKPALMAEICSAGESAKVQFAERNNAEMSENLKILAIMPGF